MATADNARPGPDDGREIGQGASLDGGVSVNPGAPVAAGAGSGGTPAMTAGAPFTGELEGLPTHQPAIPGQPVPAPSSADLAAERGPDEPEKLTVESHSVRYAERSRIVRYEIVFNRAPDFLSTDGAGAQADSFQFHMDTIDGTKGMGGASPYPWETVVRGEEIHVNGDVPIRDHTRDPSSDTGSGGWGPPATSVVYELKGKTLVFSAPFSMLGTESGKFSYALDLYRYGVWTGVSCEDKSRPLGQRESLTSRGR